MQAILIDCGEANDDMSRPKAQDGCILIFAIKKMEDNETNRRMLEGSEDQENLNEVVIDAEIGL